MIVLASSNDLLSRNCLILFRKRGQRRRGAGGGPTDLLQSYGEEGASHGPGNGMFIRVECGIFF